MSAASGAPPSQWLTRLANLRHELLAPAHAIQSYAVALLDDATRHKQKAVLPQLTHVATASRELFQLVDTLLVAGMSSRPSRSAESEPTPSRLAHELRTPLTVVKGYCELLLERPIASAGSRFQEDLARIVAETARLFVQFDRIVDFHLTASMGERLTHSLEAASGGIGDPPSGRILVVEDNDSARDLLTINLLRSGHAVDATAGGRDALARLAETAYDLVLLDLMLPDLNGFEVLLRIKDDPARCHTPVVVISGFDDIGSLKRCIEAGAEDFLPKPYDEELLQARIVNVMRQRVPPGVEPTGPEDRRARRQREMQRVLRDASEIRARDKYITSRRLAQLLASNRNYPFKEDTLRKIIDGRYPPMRQIRLNGKHSARGASKKT